MNRYVRNNMMIRNEVFMRIMDYNLFIFKMI